LICVTLTVVVMYSAIKFKEITNCISKFGVRVVIHKRLAQQDCQIPIARFSKNYHLPQ